MRHLFSNSDDELVAADTAEQAAAYWNGMLGDKDKKTLPADWLQVPDDEPTPIWSEETGERVTTTKPAREWAAEFSEPMLAASTNC